jgi:lysophospholipid acyltransferase (LPLAT)-like uncharacterized protein
MCTLRVRMSGVAPAHELMVKGNTGDGHGPLFVLWHDHSLLPLHLFRHRNIGTMMSRSRAGQMQAALWNLYGWPTVWGSTFKREGIQALREVLRGLRGGQAFAFTPDGPKGPRHRAQPGVVYLASKAPTVVIPVAVAASRAWYLPTWDKYLIPKPFSHVHLHIGEPVEVPTDLSREDTEHWRQRIEELLDAAVQVAERRVQR